MGYVSSLERDETDARGVLDTIELPADVIGYKLRLGEFGEEPALWVTFQTSIRNDAPVAELRLAAVRMNKFADRVQTAIMRVVPDRFPYVSFSAGH